MALEGDVPFSDEGGRVHLRDDALVLATVGSARRARLVAAEAGHATGLRILEASDG